jgi:hypothetical protein
MVEKRQFVLEHGNKTVAGIGVESGRLVANCNREAAITKTNT